MRWYLLVFVGLLLFMPATASARTVYLSDECDFGSPSVRPRTIVIACGDGNFGMRRLRWAGWNRSTARATGQVYANDCTPNCARGTFHYFKTTVTASRPRKQDGRYVYTRLSYTIEGITNRLELAA